MSLTRQQGSGIGIGDTVVTVSKSFGSLPALGSGVVVLVWCWHGSNATFPVNACVDNQGHTYTQAITSAAGANRGGAAVFYCPKVLTSSGTFTVTCGTDQPNSNYFGICLVEVASSLGLGILLDSPGAGNSSGSTTAIDSSATASAPSVANVFVAGCCQIAQNEASITPEVLAPVWTNEGQNLSFAQIPGQGVSRVLSSLGGVQSAKWTASTAGFWSGVVAIFREGVATGGPGRGANNGKGGGKKGGPKGNDLFGPTLGINWGSVNEFGGN